MGTCFSLTPPDELLDVSKGNKKRNRLLMVMNVAVATLVLDMQHLNSAGHHKRVFNQGDSWLTWRASQK